MQELQQLGSPKEMTLITGAAVTMYVPGSESLCTGACGHWIMELTSFWSAAESGSARHDRFSPVGPDATSNWRANL
jgi:hypothetical protein